LQGYGTASGVTKPLDINEDRKATKNRYRAFNPASLTAKGLTTFLNSQYSPKYFPDFKLLGRQIVAV